MLWMTCCLLFLYLNYFIIMPSHFTPKFHWNPFCFFFIQFCTIFYHTPTHSFLGLLLLFTFWYIPFLPYRTAQRWLLWCSKNLRKTVSMFICLWIASYLCKLLLCLLVTMASQSSLNPVVYLLIFSSPSFFLSFFLPTITFSLLPLHQSHLPIPLLFLSLSYLSFPFLPHLFLFLPFHHSLFP